MKTKIFSLLAMSAVALAACDDDVEYTQGEPNGNPSVTFAEVVNQLTTTDGSLDPIVIRRTGDTSAKSYAINVVSNKAADDRWTVPSSVEFAQGAEEAIIEIGFNTDGAERLTAYTLVLSVGDDSSTNPYFLGAPKTYVTVSYEYEWGKPQTYDVVYEANEWVGQATVTKAIDADVYVASGIDDLDDLYIQIIDGVPYVKDPIFVGEDYGGIYGMNRDAAIEAVGEDAISEDGDAVSTIDEDGVMVLQHYYVIPAEKYSFGIFNIELTPSESDDSEPEGLTEEEQKELLSLNSTIDALKALLEEESVKADADITAAVNEKIAAAEARVKELQDKAAAAELATLKAKLADLEEQVADLDAKREAAEALEAKGDDLTDEEKAELSDLKTEIKELEAIEEQIADLKKQIETLEKA